jgi:hypothetical protein
MPPTCIRFLALFIMFVCLSDWCGAVEVDDPFGLFEAASHETRKSDENLQIPILKEDRKGSGVRIVIEKTQLNEVILLFLNDSNEAVYISGHGLQSPFYEPQIFSNDQWSSALDHMNCGTGAYLSRLPAGQSFRFKVAIPIARNLFRVEIQFHGETDKAGNRKTTSIFTEPIHLTDEQAAPDEKQSLDVNPFPEPIPLTAEQQDAGKPDAKSAE